MYLNQSLISSEIPVHGFLGAGKGCSVAVAVGTVQVSFLSLQMYVIVSFASIYLSVCPRSILNI